MLTCYMCGETKPEADFAFADKARGIRQRHCRRCHAAYRRAHYLANRDDYIRREVARINKYRIENRPLMLAYLLGHPCVDCGETDPVKLDFDHRDPSEKRGNVSELAMRKPWRLVLVEIAKCDVRCANCHLKRTAQQFNWGKLTARSTIVAFQERDAWVNPIDAAPLGEIATKRCTGCGRDRPLIEFVVKDRVTQRRGTRCRSCRSAYGKAHYQRNKEAYLARNRSRRSGGPSAYWRWLTDYLTHHPCIDCGEAEIVVLQFDHREGTDKVSTIGAMLNHSSWARLFAEVAKCDVRCANCHRMRTAQQFGWSKWIRESA